jgi:DNA-binding NarL/FixJ family response regulator
MRPAAPSESTAVIAIYAADAGQRDELAALARDAGSRVAGTADTQEALRRLLDETRVDAILARLTPGRDLPPCLLERGTLLIVVAPSEELPSLRALIDRSGASLLPLPVSPRALRLAIDAAREGLRLLPAAPLSEPGDGAPPGEPLTPRELEVLNAMADGVSNKVIARRLGISFHTVKFHVAAVLEKLDADSRTEAVAAGARRGLVML